MLTKLSDSAGRTVARAKTEARSFKSELVGTDHLLLALIDDHAGGAANILAALGVSADTARGFITDTFTDKQSQKQSPTFIPTSLGLARVLARAHIEAATLHSPLVETEHILLGLAQVGEHIGGLGNPGMLTLTAQGITPDQLRRAVVRYLMASEPSE